MKKINVDHKTKIYGAFVDANAAAFKEGALTFTINSVQEKQPPSMILSAMDMRDFGGRSLDVIALKELDGIRTTVRSVIGESAVSLISVDDIGKLYTTASSSHSVCTYMNGFNRTQPLLLQDMDKHQSKSMSSLITCMAFLSSEFRCLTGENIRDSCIALAYVSMFLENNAAWMDKKYAFYHFMVFVFRQCLSMKKFNSVIKEI